MLQTFTSMKNNNTCLIHLRNERPFRLTIDSQLPNDLPIRPDRLRVSQKGTGKQRKIAGGEGEAMTSSGLSIRIYSQHTTRY